MTMPRSYKERFRDLLTQATQLRATQQHDGAVATVAELGALKQMEAEDELDKLIRRCPDVHCLVEEHAQRIWKLLAAICTTEGCQ